MNDLIEVLIKTFKIDVLADKIEKQCDKIMKLCKTWKMR